ncbi:hypothetical protein SISSUDRAFT_984412 [Sistotremastrum suecicum HHB10207 ss-3]|uniref:P/Homo B domain-containing protein n=1 Tax=Sistotremastrum suecicum HHB10207 ss-3 TaxID=1314776 RepID=A0A166EME6_9AGAM|nr:hypothetical protein SISSUDRAFT_984412 [Sistotremastrum suecicum HHB10207 ss-3]
MMLLPFTLLALLPFHSVLSIITPTYNTHQYYVLEHDPSSHATPHQCAHALGAELVERLGELDNHWIVRTPKLRLEGRDTEDRVLAAWARLRARGSELVARSSEDLKARSISRSIKSLERQVVRQRTKRDDTLLLRHPQETEPLNSSMTEQLAHRLGIEDPIFMDQWHLSNDEFPEHMMNVTGLWEMGITGQGVISAMVDDGLDFESDDLAANFDAAGSYDFNDHVPLPKPVLWDDHHGTRCAGEIAAVKNNVCGVGMAYDSKVAGIRILSGPISDIDESSALNYGYQNTSIYSCSWGPPDDGKSMEGPSLLIQKSVLNGINRGRGGKGSIFVFASGNGASSGDQCNFDGYTNSIYSVTVSAVDYKGLHPYYSEPCAANMIVTYSSGGGKHIHTTDVGKDVCASNHGGTSAAAPLAVGVFALALSVRPDLTWRDIQHLCIATAEQINSEDPDWEPTFYGKPYSYKYGWGRLDAYRYVTAAQNWKLVKPQAWAEIQPIELSDAAMNETSGVMTGGELIIPGGITSSRIITAEFLQENNLETIEHVNVRVWITHARRGDVEVEITSPAGVKSILAGRRKFDQDINGFPGWTFMTLKHWGETGVGNWTIRVSDQENPEFTGHFLGWSMILWGSSIDPSKAVEYALPEKVMPLPPHDETITTSISEIASSTKVLIKPTQHLPGDHGTAEGEADKPSFPQDDEEAANPVPSEITSTPDEGYFTHITDLLSSNTWLFGSIAIVVAFGIGCTVFLWRRRVRRRRSEYAAVMAGDSMHMSSMERGIAGDSSTPRSKELYDAFGELSDEDDADEEMHLVRGHDPDLDGDYGSGGQAGAYQDNPRHMGGITEDDRAGHRSPATDSGDGSWDHASDAR